MLSQFDTEWVLDRDTGEIVHVADLYEWGGTRTSISHWGAYVDGFTVDNADKETFSLPPKSDRPGVAVNVPLLKEMAVAGRVVELEQSEDALTVAAPKPPA